jgi:hypothetical protein
MCGSWLIHTCATERAGGHVGRVGDAVERGEQLGAVIVVDLDEGVSENHALAFGNQGHELLDSASGVLEPIGDLGQHGGLD